MSLKQNYNNILKTKEKISIAFKHHDRHNIYVYFMWLQEPHWHTSCLLLLLWFTETFLYPMLCFAYDRNKRAQSTTCANCFHAVTVSLCMSAASLFYVRQ